MKILSKYWKALAGFCLLVLAGCGIAVTLQSNQNIQRLKVSEAKKNVLTTVQTTKIQLSTPLQTLSLTGVLKAYQVLELASETDGKIIEVCFEQNQYVTAGQILAKTNAQVKQTQANLTELHYKKAKRDFERMEALFKNNNLSEIELENARFQMQTAEQNHLLSTQNVSFTLIRTPISGNITQKLATKGKYLQIGSPIAVITDISRLRLEVNIAPQDLNKMKAGTKVNMQIPSQNLRNIVGVVRSVGVQASEAGNFPVEIIIENTPQKTLLAGMEAEISIENVGNHRVMLIPRTGLLGNTVFVVEKNKAIAKRIIVGRTFGNEVEVISGLRVGDEIITKGQNNIENGQTVQIQSLP